MTSRFAFPDSLHPPARTPRTLRLIPRSSRLSKKMPSCARCASTSARSPTLNNSWLRSTRNQNGMTIISESSTHGSYRSVQVPPSFYNILLTPHSCSMSSPSFTTSYHLTSHLVRLHSLLYPIQLAHHIDRSQTLSQCSDISRAEAISETS